MAVKKAVPVKDFGKDHWSMMAYVETTCVDFSAKGVGTIDKSRVRCNQNRHPMHAVNMARLGSAGRWKSDYGTRLSGFFLEGEKRDLSRQIKSHDDWDCLDDLEAAGLLEILSEANGFVRLTDKGIAVAARIREWKAKGGMFATFKYSEPG